MEHWLLQRLLVINLSYSWTVISFDEALHYYALSISHSGGIFLLESGILYWERMFFSFFKNGTESVFDFRFVSPKRWTSIFDFLFFYIQL